jgi:superfamily I DNA and/or RNA helicase
LEKKRILTFWRDIEIFFLPDKPDKAKLAEGRLPWEFPFELEENFTYRHIVYLGVQLKQHVISLIEKEINYTPGEEHQWLEKVNGYTCMAVLVLNEKGQLANENAYLQASYLHGLLSLKEKGNLSDITARLQFVQDKFKERHPYNNAAESLEKLRSPIITREILNKEIKVLRDLNIPGIVCNSEIFVHTLKVSKKAKADTGFINSHYLEDLNRLINDSTKWNKGLLQYLQSAVEESKRVNVLRDAPAFFEFLHPHWLPAGKWPFNPDHGLYSAQTGAIHASLKNLYNEGLIGINGPPGTGKTTLLSDVIAHVITQRAIQLLHVSDHSLFSNHGVIEREPRKTYYYYPDETIFSDAGIVVASNNNAAVENISKVLPDKSKIDPNFPEADYFSAFSSGLIDGEGWGILAAALGNSENKADFKNKFWFQNKKNNGFNNFLKDLYKNEEEEDRTLIYRDKIIATKEKLSGLLKDFSKFQERANKFFDALPQQIADIKNLPVQKQQLLKTLSELELCNKQQLTIEASLQQVRQNIREIKDQIIFHRSLRPSFFFFHKLFKTRAYKAWHLSYTILQQKYHAIIEEQASIELVLYKVQLQVKELTAKKNNLETELTVIQNRQKEYQKQKAELHLLYKIDYTNLPDEHLFQAFENDKQFFHTRNPWSSKSINTLRTKIFLTSLKLHEYYVLANAKQFRNNISLLMELLDGKVQLEASLATMLWQTFFFCIPVISTSLASVSKLFGNINKDSIGWLLIDEAGQATPQSTVGIINRCRRSIIIGDPLQIEPVITTPQKLITMIRQQHNVPVEWSPWGNSTQSLADRVTYYGTYMNTGMENAIWSGFPLRTHRRCNNPMFEIANEIAYNRQMVRAVEDVDFYCPLGASTWFHVVGTTIENGQVVKEEIALLQQKVIELNKDLKNIFVISPFKSVAIACYESLLKINSSVQCGTIHTFQGKEADIVFLVLGSDPNRPGSRRWASEKANMLNVALTRAKRRFYVIGNRQLWKSFPFFSVLDKKI